MQRVVCRLQQSRRIERFRRRAFRQTLRMYNQVVFMTRRQLHKCFDFGLGFKVGVQIKHQILREKTRGHLVLLCGRGLFRFQVVFIDKSKCRRLTTPRGQRVVVAQMFPQERRYTKPHQHIQHLAGLLGPHHVHIDFARIFDGELQRRLRHFMENDSRCYIHRESKHFANVPRDGFAFSVVVCRQYNVFFSKGGYDCLHFVHMLLLVGVDRICRFKILFCIDAFQVGDTTDVAIARNAFVVGRAQIGFDRAALAARLHDDKFFIV